VRKVAPGRNPRGGEGSSEPRGREVIKSWVPNKRAPRRGFPLEGDLPFQGYNDHGYGRENFKVESQNELGTSAKRIQLSDELRDKRRPPAEVGKVSPKKGMRGIREGRNLDPSLEHHHVGIGKIDLFLLRTKGEKIN